MIIWLFTSTGIQLKTFFTVKHPEAVSEWMLKSIWSNTEYGHGRITAGPVSQKTFMGRHCSDVDDSGPCEWTWHFSPINCSSTKIGSLVLCKSSSLTVCFSVGHMAALEKCHWKWRCARGGTTHNGKRMELISAIITWWMAVSQPAPTHWAHSFTQSVSRPAETLARYKYELQLVDVNDWSNRERQTVALRHMASLPYWMLSVWLAFRYPAQF